MDFERPFVHPAKIPERVRTKWGSEVLSEGFTAFPKRLTRCLSKVLGPSFGWDHLSILLAAVDFNRPNPTRQPSLEFLSFMAGLAPARAKACLQELRDAGLIHISGKEESLRIGIDGLVKRVLQETSPPI